MKLYERHAGFFDSVYAVTLLIPRGRVTTYGAIARYLGAARSARMVGWALNGSLSEPRNIPAHRVVNQAGILTGKHHFEDPTAMQRRLEAEGVRVENDTVCDFDELFWDPQTLDNNHGTDH